MQNRHKDRRIYFRELADTSRKYYIPYLEKYIKVSPSLRILEIGCGEGGNLLPFAQLGCTVKGIDISKSRIEQAGIFFRDAGVKGTFISSDIFKMNDINPEYDIVMIHDVIEHIHDKLGFISIAKRFLAENGIMFIGFPAWQMPFGGHQQIVNNRIVSKLPYIHLLPKPCYRLFLKAFKTPKERIDELLDIKECGTTIEMFRKLSSQANMRIVDETMFLINPHYEVKFNLHPRKLSSVVSHIPYIRNFFTTSVFYILAND